MYVHPLDSFDGEQNTRESGMNNAISHVASFFEKNPCAVVYLGDAYDRYYEQCVHMKV